jgi:hypothetical protein
VKLAKSSWSEITPLKLALAARSGSAGAQSDGKLAEGGRRKTKEEKKKEEERSPAGGQQKP